MSKLSASYSLFIFYCSIMFGKQDLVHSGTTLAEAAVFIVDLTIGSSMDRTGYLAVPNTQLNSRLYFLFLGLGVGDTFAQASEAGRHTVLHPELSSAERVSRTACSDGMSVLTISVTDALAFVIKATTMLSALGWLCTWARVTIIFTGCQWAKYACGHWHIVICIPCAFRSTVPDGVVAFSAADESWACDSSPVLGLPVLQSQQ